MQVYGWREASACRRREAGSCGQFFTAGAVMPVLYSDLTGQKRNLRQSDSSSQVLLGVRAGFTLGCRGVTLTTTQASSHGFHKLQKFFLKQIFEGSAWQHSSYPQSRNFSCKQNPIQLLRNISLKCVHLSIEFYFIIYHILKYFLIMELLIMHHGNLFSLMSKWNN